MKILKKYSVYFVVGLIALFTGLTLRGAQVAYNQTVLSLRFGGTDVLGKDTNSTRLEKIFSLKESSVLKDEIVGKLSGAIARLLTSGDVKNDVIAPLTLVLNDLTKREFHLQVISRQDAVGEVIISVNLADNSGGVWNSNLIKFVEDLSGGRVSNTKFSGASGWERKLNGKFTTIRCSRAGNWTVIGLSADKPVAFNNTIQQIQKRSKPYDSSGSYWIEGDINLRWLSTALGLPLSSNIMSAKIVASNKANDVRSVLTLQYTAPIKWTQEQWKVPAETISDPLISFTAINGASSLLSEIDIIKKLNIQPLPNQLYLWALSGIPFMSYFAVPVADATNIIRELATRLPPLVINPDPKRNNGNIFWISNKAELVWQGLPVMAPLLKAITEKNGQFVVGGLFPVVTEKKTPIPKELLNQFIGRTNIMYYDWELTQERVVHWLQIYQLLPIFTSVPQVLESSPGQKWILKIAPELGDCATEIALTKPAEVTITRRSPIGFTGFELVQLARWFDSTNFPYGSGGNSGIGAQIPERKKK